MFATIRKLVLVAVSFLLLVSVATAQNNRSAVSVTGNDAASCTVPDPCRTFTVALSKTNPNGEVVALTSGGYGPFNLAKSATIVAAPGIYAALVNAAGDAIFVDAGAGAKVVIRGLHMYGMGSLGSGIGANGSGEEVHVENCVIDGFTIGVLASLNTRVSNTTIRNGAFGILIENGTAAVKATINHVDVRDMFNGGIRASTNANVTVRDSVATDCTNGFQGVNAAGQINIENSLATNNSVVGVRADSGGTVRVSNTMATDNATGFANDLTSTFVSFGNNKVRGNTTDKSGTLTVVGQD